MHFIWLIFFILILIAEIFLSHQNGYKSGEESLAIAKALHLSNQTIRLAAHIILFAIIMFTGLMTFPEHTVLVIVAIVLWAVLDEVTKPLLNNFRHMSLFDMGMNMIGVMIGIGLKFLIVFL